MSAPVFKTILEGIGNTPMVRLNRVGSEFPVEVWAKCEFLSSGGSTKDRIALSMIEDAEAKGLIKPGDTLVEPTSGNTGIGLAMVAAVKGYKLVICMPMKMSAEKQATMEALGAIIIRTPTEAPSSSPESNFGVAKRLVEEKGYFMLDQFKNQANPMAHYNHTGTEILEQMERKIDYLVCSIGTGGSLTGMGRKIKEELPNCQIIAVDPVGSIMGGGTETSPYLVEGIGYDFIPETYDPTLADRVVKTRDKESFAMARRLIKDEGLLVGGSSGSVVWAALQVAKDAPAGSRMVVILADSVRNYMSKFLQDSWLEANGLLG
ncbi:MAG: pyridoxal-phosphate dependent enzyme [Fimbriimonadaceae bacterium]